MSLGRIEEKLHITIDRLSVNLEGADGDKKDESNYAINVGSFIKNISAYLNAKDKESRENIMKYKYIFLFG